MSNGTTTRTFGEVARASMLALTLASAVFAGCTSTHTQRCIPGQAAGCSCDDGRAGAQTCSPEGTFDACTCSSCADGASYACACADGRTGLATCEGGAVGACTCLDVMLTPCTPGARSACSCEGNSGSMLCGDDRRFGACVCGNTCEPDTAVACRCLSGHDGVTTCVDGRWSVCACVVPDAAYEYPDAFVPEGSDAFVPDAGPLPEPECPACGCEPEITEATLPPATSFDLGVDLVQLFAFAEGYVAVTTSGLTQVGRDGAVVTTRTTDTIHQAVRVGEWVVVERTSDLDVWTSTLELVRSVPLTAACSTLSPLPCGRVACSNLDRVVVLDLVTGERLEGPRAFGGFPVPDHAAATNNGQYVRLEGATVSVVRGASVDPVIAVGPRYALTVWGSVLSLEGCQSLELDRCLVTTVARSRYTPTAVWGRDGAFHAYDGQLYRLDPETGVETFTASTDLGPLLAYDPWSRTVLAKARFGTAVRAIPLP